MNYIKPDNHKMGDGQKASLDLLLARVTSIDQLRAFKVSKYESSILLTQTLGTRVAELKIHYAVDHTLFVDHSVKIRTPVGQKVRSNRIPTSAQDLEKCLVECADRPFNLFTSSWARQ